MVIIGDMNVIDVITFGILKKIHLVHVETKNADLHTGIKNEF